ncbi:MAG: GGDEF domain-containing protein [Burkholderiales bacterium]
MKPWSTTTHALRVFGLLACVAQAGAAPPTATDFEARIDALARIGIEHPAQALTELTALQRERHGSVRERRLLLQAMGGVEVQAGATARAGRYADQLQALAADDPSGQAQASAALVRAQMAEAVGQLDAAAVLAQSALPAFQAGCAGTAAKSASAAVSSADCDYRSAWTALMLLERRAAGLGVTVTATNHAQAALNLAEAAGDAPRQTSNLASLALLAQGRGEREAAVWLMAQARRMAMQSNDPTQPARLGKVQAKLARMQGDERGNLQALEEALALAAQVKAPRLETQLLVNVGDAYERMGRPADALRAAERALPLARRFNDARTEGVLINNIGVAKIGVGRVAEGRQDLARVLELWQQTGEVAHQVQTLLEFGEALAKAGDAHGALELYHRERELSAELMRTNRTIALKELQTRNDADARQRDIELLSRDNALKSEALANRDLMQRIWWLLAAVMALACALVAMLYLRVRETNRRLAASHVQLQAQSERDPLTNLANRRHFQAVMTQTCQNGGFEGALLLVDIDHFKHVNDAHGHAAGDQVLVEVARRLNEAVRSDDLVVRWGGEEFLIFAPRAAPEQAEQMAARVLRILSATPIETGSAPLRVTASIGYVRFPLPHYRAEVPWEQAINLADMALYTAKNQGRHRAVGIVSTTAASTDELREIEADFDRAWHAGGVTLLQTPGPESRDTLRAA